jgi:hypothetical protein
MSKGSSRRQLTVDWDSTLRLWKKRPEQDGFFELLEPFSETWPASGSMRNGHAWQRRRSALPTAGSGSSSTPGALFKTPTSNLGINGGSQHPDKRKAGGHGPTLADEVEHLLPTPAARDWKSGESNLMDRNSRPLNEVVVNLLPTPTASNPNDGESLESWEARRKRNLAKGINGNGQGTPLAIAVKLLPTPRASDGEKGGPNQRGSKGDLMLPSAAAQLLPTPTASDSERTSSSYGRGNPTLTGAITDPPSAAGNKFSDAPPPGPLTLWDD